MELRKVLFILHDENLNNDMLSFLPYELKKAVYTVYLYISFINSIISK